jgi:hypothetical protein
VRLSRRSGSLTLKHVPTLIARGLWHAAGHTCDRCPQPVDPHGWIVHDYLDYNPSRADIEADRKAARDRMARRRRNLRGEFAKHSDEQLPEPPANDRANFAGSSANVRPPRPVPTRPDPGSTSQTSSPPPGSVPGEPKAGGGDEYDADPALQTFVTEVQELRPEWSRRSIVRALTHDDVIDRPWDVVQAAMRTVAGDRASHAPGRLAANGPWWTAAGASSAPAAPLSGPTYPLTGVRDQARISRGVTAAKEAAAARIAAVNRTQDDDPGGDP